MTMEISLDLKDFYKLNRVSKGSFGDVFLMKCKKSNEIYSGKFTVHTISDNKVSDELTREIGIISKINHPSIIKLIGISPIDYEKKHNPVIVTEYLPNGSLDQIINLAIHGHAPERWDDTQKLITLYGIASGMACLHSQNILHRDLKPSNILLDEYLFPKICDFGLSNEKKRSTPAALIPKGSPLYMAPEIFKTSNYSKASDVYAYAIIAYQIICDEKPISVPENPRKLMIRVIDGKRYAFNCPINKSYRRLIRSCWNQDIKKRLTFDQIKEELKTDPGFITETVDEERFLKYVDYIDNQKSSYDSSSSISISNPSTKDKSNDDKSNDGDEVAPDDFPQKIYKKLDQEGKDLVCKAINENDSNAQYSIAINFLHRANKFPKNSKLGIMYLKMAVDNGNMVALKNYCRKVIDDDLTSEDIDLVRVKLNRHIKSDDPDIFLLYGLLCIKENKVKEAEKYFEKASREGNSEAMYELGTIYFNLNNCKKAHEYFDMAKKNGFTKNPPKIGKTSETLMHPKTQTPENLPILTNKSKRNTLKQKNKNNFGSSKKFKSKKSSTTGKIKVNNQNNKAGNSDLKKSSGLF